MKKVFSILCVVVAFIAISSCAKKENYPDYPVITFNSLTHYVPGDSIDIQFNFTDGNGQIGYATNDTSAPYNCYLMYNYDSSGVWKFDLQSYTKDPATGDTICFKYHIPNITPTGSNKELNGLIQVRLQRAAYYDMAHQGDQFRFWIWIIDRNNNKSNRIWTTATLMP